MPDITYTSKGQGALNTVLGAIGTAGATGILGNLGGIFGKNCGGCGNMRNGCGGNGCGDCSDDHYVDRYDAGKDAQIAQLKSEVKFLESTIHTDGKSLELYKYIDGELTKIRNALCDQRVHNQRTEDSFALAHADLEAVKRDLECKINREAERRCCNDSAIVNYVNATFYPKMAADVTTGTTTTAQTLYNPIANCGKGCDCGC